MSVRNLVCWMLVGLVVVSSVGLLEAQVSASKHPRGVLGDSHLASLGLARDWLYQVKINRERAEILYLLYDDKTLFVVASDATLHALNAETGGFLWSAVIGQSDSITLEPAVNSRIVAIINGTSVTAYDRFSGNLVWQSTTPGVPLSGCALSENYIYIPQMNGRIVAFNFDYNAGANIEQKVVQSKDAAPKVLTEDSNFDKLDDDMKKVVKAFEQTKRDILPLPTEPKVVPKVQLNPGMDIPVTQAVSGQLWISPTVCLQELKYGLPLEKLRDDYAGKVSYDDFLVIDHKEHVAWVSSLGKVFLASIEDLSTNRFDLRYEVRIAPQSYSRNHDSMVSSEVVSDNPIVASPTYVRPKLSFLAKDKGDAANAEADADRDGTEADTTKGDDSLSQRGLLVVGSVSGYVFAIEEGTGRVRWQFAADGPVTEQVSVVDGVAYASIDRGGMHAINIETGKEVWYTKDIRSFIAASPTRLYTTAQHDTLTVLDRATGRVVARGPSLEGYALRYRNTTTDQLFIANRDGLIQALSEVVYSPSPGIYSSQGAAVSMSPQGADAMATITAKPRHIWEPSLRDIVEAKKRYDAPDDEFRAILDGIVAARTPKPKEDKPAPASRLARPATPRSGTRTTPATSTDADPFADPFSEKPQSTGGGSNVDDDPFADTSSSDPFGDTPKMPAGNNGTSGDGTGNLDDDDPFK